MQLSYIYKCTNIVNGKVYIGYTVDLGRRISSHKYDAFRRNKNTKLYNAMRKYGFESFTWEIIYASWDRVHCLDVAENDFIIQYDSINEGYNSMQGGQRGPSLHGADNGMYGKTHTAEFKQAQSKRAIAKFKNRSYEDLYGVEKAIELKQKRSNTMKNQMKVTACDGEHNRNFKPDMVYLKHIDGRTYEGTRLAINTELQIPRAQISRLIKLKGQVGKRGRPFNYGGWSVA